MNQKANNMAKHFDNTNRGALFKNDDKDGENDRDYSGTLNVEGVSRSAAADAIEETRR
jgi:hypothetical protein